MKGIACAMFLLLGCSGSDPEAPEPEEAAQIEEESGCTRDSDLVSLDTKYTAESKEPEELAGSCSVVCYFDPERQECITQCIVEGTSSELSTGCSHCLALAAECGSANCAVECSIDVSSDECVACRCGENDLDLNCEELYERCSGILSPVCR